MVELYNVEIGRIGRYLQFVGNSSFAQKYCAFNIALIPTAKFLN